MTNEIQQLIPIEERNGQQAINARHLYAWLGIGREFTHWMKDQIVRCDLIENQDFEVFAQKGINPQGGRPSTEYALSMDAAKEISMMSQTEKGKQARRYFIECEKKAKALTQTKPTLPQTYKQALKELLAQVEKNEQLELENKQQQLEITNLSSRTEIQAETIRVQSKELTESRDKVQKYDSTMSTDGLFTATKIADSFGISAKKLNKILEILKIQYRQSGCYHLYSEYKTWKGQKLAKIIPNPYFRHDGSQGSRDGLYWTVYGREFLLVDKANKIKELIPVIKV